MNNRKTGAVRDHGLFFFAVLDVGAVGAHYEGNYKLQIALPSQILPLIRKGRKNVPDDNISYQKVLCQDIFRRNNMRLKASYTS